MKNIVIYGYRRKPKAHRAIEKLSKNMWIIGVILFFILLITKGGRGG